MNKYSVVVSKWTEYIIEVEAESKEQAENIGRCSASPDSCVSGVDAFAEEADDERIRADGDGSRATRRDSPSRRQDREGDGMTGKMREAFEDMMSSQGEWPQAIEKNADGGYLLKAAATGWETWQDAWQASRAGLEEV